MLIPDKSKEIDERLKAISIEGDRCAYNLTMKNIEALCDLYKTLKNEKKV